MSRSTVLFISAAIVLLSILPYVRVIHSPFQYDDRKTIVENHAIRDAGDLGRVISTEYSRPIFNISLALNYAAGELDTRGYHIFNLIVHALAALAVWRLSTGLFFFLGGLGDAYPSVAGAIPALLFAVHPLQTEAVSYITGRSSSLCTLFYLISALSYLEYRSGRRSRPRVLWAASFISFLLALGTKEIAVTLPFILLLFESMNLPTKKGTAVENKYRALLPFFLLFPLLGLFRLFTLGALFNPRDFRTVGENLLSQAAAFAQYVRLLLIPVGQSIDHDAPVYGGLALPVITGLLLFGAIAAAAFFTRKLIPVVAFGLAWFLVTLLPTTSFIPLLDVMAERRLYLPSVGLFLAAGFGVVSVRQKLSRLERGDRARYLLYSGLSGVLMLLIGLTVLRNELWRSSRTLWADAVAKASTKARPHNNLGLALLEDGDRPGAMNEFRQALEKEPGFLDAAGNLALCLEEEGRFAEAKSLLESALEHPTYDEMAIPRVLFNLARLRVRKGDFHQAQAHLLKALSLAPDYGRAHLLLGQCRVNLGHYAEAEASILRALELGAARKDALFQLGQAREGTGRTEQALGDYQQAAAAGSVEAVLQAAGLHYRAGRLKQALEAYQVALGLLPDDPTVHQYLGATHLRLGNNEAALRHLERYLALAPDGEAAPEIRQYVTQLENN